MKKLILTTIINLILLSGCTQIVTAPIKVAGAVVGTAADITSSAVGATIDVAGSTAHAVVGSDDD